MVDSGGDTHWAELKSSNSPALSRRVSLKYKMGPIHGSLLGLDSDGGGVQKETVLRSVLGDKCIRCPGMIKEVYAIIQI